MQGEPRVIRIRSRRGSPEDRRPERRVPPRARAARGDRLGLQRRPSAERRLEAEGRSGPLRRARAATSAFWSPTCASSTSTSTARSRSRTSTPRSPGSRPSITPARPRHRRRSGRLGERLLADLRERRALAELPDLHDPGDADRVGRHLLQPADPDRRGDGRRSRLRADRRRLRRARQPQPRARPPLGGGARRRLRGRDRSSPT